MTSIIQLLTLCILAILGIAYLISAVQVRRGRQSVNSVVSWDDIMSGRQIKGYNRQSAILNNRPIFGVNNQGVTMDGRKIYVPSYHNIGIEGMTDDIR